MRRKKIKQRFNYFVCKDDSNNQYIVIEKPEGKEPNNLKRTIIKDCGIRAGEAENICRELNRKRLR
jgi:hypothetical protein